MPSFKIISRGPRAARAATLGLAAAVATAMSLLAMPAANASTTVNGQVTCVDGLNVEGVWIAASGGSGYASWSPVSGAPYAAGFSRAGVTVPWTVHVGCGGSPSSWKWTPDGNTTVTSASASWTCYEPDDGSPAYFCQHT
jgi:hypothetical protein